MAEKSLAKRLEQLTVRLERMAGQLDAGAGTLLLPGERDELLKKIAGAIKFLESVILPQAKRVNDMTSDERLGFERKIEAFEEAIAKRNLAIKAMNEEIDKLSALIAPPKPYASFFRLVSAKKDKMENGRRVIEPATADIIDNSGKMYLVNVEGNIEALKLKRGQRVRLSPQGNIMVALEEFGEIGQTGRIANLLSGNRVLITGSTDAEEILFLADTVNPEEIKVGAKVAYSSATRMIFAVIKEEKKSAMQMESVQDIGYDQIGGLAKAIEEFEEQIMFPRLHPKNFSPYRPDMPKGVVLYGPPGCGKTLLARAAASRIQKLGYTVRMFIANGPEFLIKWVGDSEAKVREPADYAKAHPNEVVLYIVDEMESVLRTRGSIGGHAGVGDSIVTQFNSILDGFIGIPNMIFIGITNRLDLVDSSILRPGRLDLQLKIPRPDREGARNIMRVYLKPDMPFNAKYFDLEREGGKYKSFGGDPAGVLEYLIEESLKHIYDASDAKDRRRVAMIEFEDTGDTRELVMADFVSGALLKDIVNRAKLDAALYEMKGGERGLRLKYLHDAIDRSFKSLRDQINKSHPEEWARLADLPVDRYFRVLHKDEEEGDSSATGFNSRM
jgi:proteasome-associated ATPase